MSPRDIRIETPRLLLREYRPEDLEAHHGLISDANVMRFMQDVYSRSFEDSVSNLAAAAAAKYEEDPDFVFLVIADRSCEVYMGGIGYSVLERSPAGKKVEAGYFLKPQHWNRGYCSEALAALLEFAFRKDGVRRVDMCCISENAASARVMEKCGLFFEGERRDFEWHTGCLRSRMFFGLLKEDWERAEAVR